ncbi:hypothetical protein [Paenibacillus sedimenti]|uniref:Uncharacterized protein n=1 Tax=Paenibacillus sedimenti TaxID=2770274 RepID=A0A926QKY3_9BACL|nr:hypothetical protein [Paenibacillus sedimenti]MBD0383306.1 hypothetical protein [Paenibacillus sedimenti]
MFPDVKEYRQSELYSEIVRSFNGNEHLQRLYIWFGEKWGVKVKASGHFGEDEWLAKLSIEDQ